MYRIECSEEFGILLWLDAPCGLKQPMIRWDGLEEVKIFAESLLEFYHQRRMRNETEKRKAEDYSAAENLLRRALGDSNESLDKLE